MELKNYIAESFNKEYAYRVKLAHDCGADQMDMFVNQERKQMTLDIDLVRNQAERIYHPK